MPRSKRTTISRANFHENLPDFTKPYRYNKSKDNLVIHVEFVFRRHDNDEYKIEVECKITKTLPGEGYIDGLEEEFKKILVIQDNNDMVLYDYAEVATKGFPNALEDNPEPLFLVALTEANSQVLKQVAAKYEKIAKKNKKIKSRTSPLNTNNNVLPSVVNINNNIIVSNSSHPAHSFSWLKFGNREQLHELTKRHHFSVSNLEFYIMVQNNIENQYKIICDVRSIDIDRSWRNFEKILFINNNEMSLHNLIDNFSTEEYSNPNPLFLDALKYTHSDILKRVSDIYRNKYSQIDLNRIDRGRVYSLSNLPEYLRDKELETNSSISNTEMTYQVTNTNNYDYPLNDLNLLYKTRAPNAATPLVISSANQQPVNSQQISEPLIITDNANSLDELLNVIDNQIDKNTGEYGKEEHGEINTEDYRFSEADLKESAIAVFALNYFGIKFPDKEPKQASAKHGGKLIYPDGAHFRYKKKMRAFVKVLFNYLLDYSHEINPRHLIDIDSLVIMHREGILQALSKKIEQLKNPFSTWDNVTEPRNFSNPQSDYGFRFFSAVANQEATLEQIETVKKHAINNGIRNSQAQATVADISTLSSFASVLAAEKKSKSLGNHQGTLDYIQSENRKRNLDTRRWNSVDENPNKILRTATVEQNVNTQANLLAVSNDFTQNSSQRRSEVRPIVSSMPFFNNFFDCNNKDDKEALLIKICALKFEVKEGNYFAKTNYLVVGTNKDQSGSVHVNFTKIISSPDSVKMVLTNAKLVDVVVKDNRQSYTIKVDSEDLQISFPWNEENKTAWAELQKRYGSNPYASNSNSNSSVRLSNS